MKMTKQKQAGEKVVKKMEKPGNDACKICY
jgi:hypothetical protein